jgi:RNA-binding protein 39
MMVSQLTTKVVERDVEDYFGLAGTVKHVSLPREGNRRSGRHKGFAYVEMAQLEDIPNCLLLHNMSPDFQKFPILVQPSGQEASLAHKAASVLAYGSSSGGHNAKSRNAAATAASAPITAAFAPAPPPPPPPPPESSMECVGSAGVEVNVNKMYIGGLHPEVTEGILLALLVSKVELPVLCMNLLRDDTTRRSKGFAFARFDTEEGMEKALRVLEGVKLFGREIKVSKVRLNTDTAQERERERQDRAALSSFVPGLGDQSGDWRLDSGGGTGLDANSRMSLMAKLGRSAGLEMPQPTAIHGADLLTAAGPAVPPMAGVPSTCFVVANMFDPAEETEEGWDLDIKEDVSDECSRFGTVLACHVEKVKRGGLVFIKFAAIDHAQRAASSLHGRYFAKRMITVSYFPVDSYDKLTTEVEGGPLR